MSNALVRLGLVVTAAAFGGFVFSFAGLPAGWLLGSLVASAIFRELAGEVRFTGKLRRAGQLIVGTAVAGLLSPTIVTTIGGMFGWILLTAITINLICLAISFPIARLSGMDRRTSALCCLPGGLSEMAALAREVDANDQAVAIFHTIRVTLIVIAIPLLLGGLGFEETISAPVAAGSGSYWPLILIALISAPLAAIASRVGIINPWVVTPIVIGISAVLLGAEARPMPVAFGTAAQIVIGVALGARLDRIKLMALPRVFVVGFLFSLALVATTLLVGGLLLPQLVDVSFGTGVVSMAPGGIAEMIAVAKAMDLLPTTVAAFGIMRSVLTNTVMSQIVSRLPN